MKGYWLTLYDGNGRRLGHPWHYETQAEAEAEAQSAFNDSEKVREAVIWHRQSDVPGGDWYWQKAAEVRR